MAARWDPLFRTAYLLAANAPEAEDLLQNALAKTFVRWRFIRDKGAADAYVRRAMLNQMSRQWKRSRREVPMEQVPDGPSNAGPIRAVEHADLWAAIRSLPPRMRAVLVLRHLEDLSEAETAEALGCTVGTVKSQTHDALARLRAVLPDHQLANGVGS